MPITGQGGTTNRTVTIRAKGSNPNQWPIMQLWGNGAKRQQWTVSTGTWTNYTATVPLTGRDQVDIVFPNYNGVTTSMRAFSTTAVLGSGFDKLSLRLSNWTFVPKLNCPH